jgi:threonine 3-dehydrogenase
VLIKVKAAAICGSDLNVYVWNRAFCESVVKKLPFIPGHECAGEVVETGSDVSKFAVGDRVAVETHIPCGHCRQCQIGRAHTCTNMKLFGYNVNGCFAEYAIVAESAVRRIPDGISYENGAMLEPLGVVVRPVLDAAVGMSTICVTGCGPIGQFAISLSAILGASRIYAVDINGKRLSLAKEMGATDLINSSDNPQFGDYLIEQGRIDVLIEASGKLEPMNEGLKSLNFGGKMQMIGQPKQTLQINNPMQNMISREIIIRGYWGRELFRTWEMAERFILSGKINMDKIITHRFPLNRFEEAFEVAMSGEGCKVVLLPE